MKGNGFATWAGFASQEVQTKVRHSCTSGRVISAPPGFVILHREFDESRKAWAPEILHLAVLGWAYGHDGGFVAALTCEGPMVDWPGLLQPDGTVLDLYGGRFASVAEFVEKSEVLNGVRK